MLFRSNIDGGVIEKISTAHHSCLEAIVLSAHPEGYIKEQYPSLSCKIFKKPIDHSFIDYIQEVLLSIPKVYCKNSSKLDDLRLYEAKFLSWAQIEIEQLFKHGQLNPMKNDDFFSDRHKSLAKLKMYCQLDDLEDMELHIFWTYKIGTAEEIISKNLVSYVKKRLEPALVFQDLKIEGGSRYCLNLDRNLTTEDFLSGLGRRIDRDVDLKGEIRTISLDFSSLQEIWVKINDKTITLPDDLNQDKQNRFAKLNRTIELFLASLDTIKYLEVPSGSEDKENEGNRQETQKKTFNPPSKLENSDASKVEADTVEKVKKFFNKLIS